MFDLTAYHQQVMSPVPTGGTNGTDVTQGGFGMSLQNPPAFEPFWHSGGLPGLNAYMEVWPSAGYGLAVMVNADGGPDPTGANPKNVAATAMNDLFGQLKKLNASVPQS
jgi:hypothetical protein